MFGFLKRAKQPKPPALEQLMDSLSIGSYTAAGMLVDGWPQITDEEEMSPASQYIATTEMLFFLLHMMDRFASVCAGQAVRQKLDEAVVEEKLTGLVSEVFPDRDEAGKRKMLSRLVNALNTAEEEYSEVGPAEDMKTWINSILGVLRARLSEAVAKEYSIPVQTAVYAAGAESLIVSNLKERVEAACRELE